MKQKTSIKHTLVLFVVIIFLAGCSVRKDLTFANREWHVSDYYGQIIDKDTTYRMTFGNVLIPDPLLIVSSADSVAKYPGMDKFLSDILHTAHLDNAEILFYAPYMHTMFVRPNGILPPMKPSSISSPMYDAKPYTMWVNKDDIEDWTRDSREMYTYTYYDKGKKQLMIVDHYDYGDIPIAQITIFQSRNKLTSKMGINDNLRRAFFELHDLGKYMDNVEYWSHSVETRRANAFSNYKIGQEQARRRFNAARTLARADSALFAGSFSLASEQNAKYLKYESSPDNTVIYNAACATSLSGEISRGLAYLVALANRDSTWYLKEPLDHDLLNLTDLPEWDDFYKMISERRMSRERNFDTSLRRRLTQIRRSDQDVRHRFLTAYNAQTPDTLLINRLLQEMEETDAANLTEIDSILNEFGWPGRDRVGDECVAIWLVLQHADIESQTKALPMLKSAAEKGDIDPSAIAMLEDRILVNSGKRQIYGTQYYYEDDDGAKKRIIYPIEDVENVDNRRIAVGLQSLRETYTKEEIGTIR